ncbi:glutamate-5-semialdehyde dehydrogenase, partial [termite gut metagenome]
MNKLNDTLKLVRTASRELILLTDEQINKILLAVADAAIEQTAYILAENEKDLARMDKDDPKYDRLMLTEKRIKDITEDIRSVSTLPSPLGRILLKTTRPNGMKLTKISVPFGVIGII